MSSIKFSTRSSRKLLGRTIQSIRIGLAARITRWIRKADKLDYESASGDAHLWDVWHGDQPFSWYVEHLDYRLSHRNQDLGNITIARYLASMFKMPNGFENWAYLSQVMHGEGMKVAAESYRCNYPRTRGVLYWQLNDNWPTISGSSMDYFGRWKALQYMVRHFFNPVLVCGRVEGARVKIWGVNDLLQEVPGTLEWALARFDGTEIKRGAQDVLLPTNGSTLLAELDLAHVVGENPEHTTYRDTNYANRARYYLTYRLVQGECVLSSNISFFAPFKYLALEQPQLRCQVAKENDCLVVTIAAERFAAFVELGLANDYARFSDNYFHLLPGKLKKIQIVECSLVEEEVSRRFYVKSLFHSFAEDVSLPAKCC